jgi:hypothetical protein
MASILFRVRLAPAIGILGGGELGGEGVREGATGNESRSGVGNKSGFKEKDNELKLAGAPLFTGVGKSSVVLGLCQGTASEERGVTRISPSDPRPGGENSAGTLPKFRKWETSEKVCWEAEEKKMEFLQKEITDYLVQRWKLLLQRPFLF